MNILIACATALFCAIGLGAAVTSPSILQLRIGMSSDSAIAVIGGDLVRDTTWTGAVHRRVALIRLRVVTYYGVAGLLNLSLTEHGTLHRAQWLGGGLRSQVNALTAEDFKNFGDSLESVLGAPDSSSILGDSMDWSVDGQVISVNPPPVIALTVWRRTDSAADPQRKR